VKPTRSGPNFVSYFNPVLDALRALGASAKPREVFDWIIESKNVPDSVLTATNKNGGSKFENQVAWARFYLAKAGFIDTGKHGIWSLTESGRKAHLTHQEALEVFRSVQIKFPKKVETDPNHRVELSVGSDEVVDVDATDTDVPDTNEFLNQEDIETSLVEKLRGMTDKGFEEFCARLLREFGLENVRVIGKSGDDGIDGVGELLINRFVRSKVMFQCKRYTHSVSPKEIRDFRGAIQGRAERGIFLTTGTYTKNAKQEATRENTTPIELVDLSDLIQLIIEKNLGVNERRALEIDSNFFAQFS
jgi:restriction system protein